LECALQPKIAKINKTLYLKISGSFIVIDVDTTEKLVTSACSSRLYEIFDLTYVTLTLYFHYLYINPLNCHPHPQFGH